MRKNGRKWFSMLLAASLALTFTACGQSGAPAAEKAEQAVESIDYMVLVNKNNALPGGWEDVLETVHMTNSVGDDVEVEKKAYDAYLRLKEDLEGGDWEIVDYGY